MIREDVSNVLADTLPYLQHRNKKWVSHKPNDFMLRDREGHWEGVQCKLTDGFDQSGDWRCNCGRDALVRRINKLLKEF